MEDDEFSAEDKKNESDELFPEFDDIDDRDGDPFEEFESPAESEGTETPTDTGTSDSQSGSPSSNSDVQVSDESPSSNDTENVQREGMSASDRAAPSMDIQEDMFETDHGDEDPFGDDSPFQKVEIETIDEEDLWEEIQSGESDTLEDSTPTVESPINEVVVSKSRFCHQCEHFSEPPKIGCGHDGTEILEFVGADDIRISNCPVVAKERELGHDIE